MSRPLAPISLDLDNKWSYLMVHGEESWTTYPSYLDTLVPRVLDLLDQRGLKITFFVVGRDATFEQNRDLLTEIVRRGHRVGNHSFDHRPWLHRYSQSEVVEEFDRAENAIGEAMGVKPVGFRGPGFSLTNGVIAEMIRRGYQYDASVFPNILNPLSRAYYFKTTNLTPEQKEERSQLFGSLRDALRPNRSFHWKSRTGALLEIPVTTFPALRTPIHLSYLIYLGGRTRTLASAYFGAALSACRLSSNPPSILLHPLDFLGSDDEGDLSFFPGMNLPVGQKLELANRFLDQLERSFELVPLETYAAQMRSTRPRRPDYYV